ncbi:DUF2339 domain-containing protein [Bowmanella denitrificans]|uniref:DUF2339 domain-containing protein n=1 Tax=Bowmanella denitrificans TaxID=366582 RepID=A0ABN0XIW2_9ALTE
MEAIFGLIILLAALAGVIAFFKVQSLSRELSELRRLVTDLNSRIVPASSAQMESTERHKTVDNINRPVNVQPKPAIPSVSPAAVLQVKASANQWQTSFKAWQNAFEQNGMVWIGAVALALGGIFLASYSLERGLLSPLARILLGSVFGVGLILTSLWLHRRAVVFEGYANYIPAALASGGFISCFAMVLLAFYGYQMLGNLSAFVLLAIVALSASYLSLLLGPLLAAIGIVGAYTVPLWLGADSGSLFALLSYVLFVGLAVLLLARRVQQSWLWYALYGGHFGWYMLALIQGQASDSSLFSGFVLLTLYGLVVWPVCGWRLQSRQLQSLPFRSLLQADKENAALLLSLLPALVFLLSISYQTASLTLLLALAFAMLVLPRLHCRFSHCALLTLPIFLVGIMIVPTPVRLDELSGALSGNYLLVVGSALLLFVYGLALGRQQTKRLECHLLAAFAPFILIGVGYSLAPTGDSGLLYPFWATMLLLMSMGLAGLAWRTAGWQAFCYVAGSNANLALSLTMLLNDSALTLALLTQVLVISYLAQKRQLALPHWIVKLLVSLILLRLSLAPWTPGYDTLQLLGLHWSIVVYPLAIGLFYLSARLWQASALYPWLLAAVLHLFALLVTTETSYLLVGHYPQPGALSFQETVLLAMNWLLLGAMYLYRASFAGNALPIYRFAGILLCIAAGLLQLQLLVDDNPFFIQQGVGQWPLLNWLLPLWAVPAALLFYLSRGHLAGTAAKVVKGISALLAFLFVNAVIRQAWQGEEIHLWLATSDAEQYSYSLVWLLIASSLVGIAYKFVLPGWQRLGFGLLLMVILKVFIVDMANLQGLFRAVSFIGLGLCLVALGWLFQRLRQSIASEPDYN